MAILRRTRKAELPTEVPNVTIAKHSSKTKNLKACEEEFLQNIDEIIKDPSYYSTRLRAAGIRPRKKKVLGDITYGEVENAIWHSSGQIVSVARQLNISVAHVQSIFKRYKLLETEFIEFREAITDEVEQALLAKIRNGDTASTLFYLKCHGKSRGYVDHESGSTASKRGVRMKIVKAKKGSNVMPFIRSANGA